MKPGDVIVLTGQALRSMGARTGDAGTQRWTVVECTCELCATERFVGVEGGRHFALAAVREWDRDRHRDEGTPAQTSADTAGIARGMQRASKRPFARSSRGAA
jgi:hypothetical protein